MNRTRFLIAIVGLTLWVAAGTLAAQAVSENSGADPHTSASGGTVSQASEQAKVTTAGPATESNEVDLYILLDDESTASLGSQLQDIRHFIDAQPASTRIGVAYMRNGIARIQQEPTGDHSLAAKALRLPLGAGGANGSPYIALSDLVKRWPNNHARREVLMISDGVDHYYDGNDLLDPYLAASIEKAHRADIVVSTIYTPGVGRFARSDWHNYLGQVYLAQVAQQTGGESYYIGFNDPAVSFAPFLRDFSNRLAEPQRKAGMEPAKSMIGSPAAEQAAADKENVPAGR